MIYIIFIIFGCIIGFMAGLLGIGGGSIIIPVLNYVAEQQGFSTEIIMKMSLGTSFAIIIISTASSAWSHSKRGTVLWNKIPYLGIGAAIGVTIGSAIVNLLPNTALKIIFCFFLIYTIYSLLSPKKAQLDNVTEPNFPLFVFLLMGLLIGFLSSFIGIAGGAITVPLLCYLGYEMRRSIATSAAIGVILSCFGTISYVYNGWGHEALPPHSIGFVYLPAFFGIAFMSIFTAPFGVKLSYVLPVQRIRQIFALFLAIVLVRMLSGFFL